MAEEKIRLRLNAYQSKSKGIDYTIECCGEHMTGKKLKSEHWNDNPIKWKCEICGKSVKTNISQYDCPKPQHIGFELEV